MLRKSHLGVKRTRSQRRQPEAAVLPGPYRLDWRTLQRAEALFTDPADEIVQRVVKAATEVLGNPPALNMRVGASDARLYRLFGIPSVVYGPTPFGMGGPDEHVRVDELVAVAKVHALAGFDFLSAS